MQHQHVVGEPNLDSTDHSLRKQEGLRLSLEKLGVGDVIIVFVFVIVGLVLLNVFH